MDELEEPEELRGNCVFEPWSYTDEEFAESQKRQEEILKCADNDPRDLNDIVFTI
jgi:hypothetical protein